MSWNVYLSGEIHTDWRDNIEIGAQHLDIKFTCPVTDHEASDDCGSTILGPEEKKFWKDDKTSEEWKNKNLEIIVSRMKGWQLSTFKESYDHKIKKGISLFKKNLQKKEL